MKLINSAVALSRMDLPCDPAIVKRLLKDFDVMSDCYTKTVTAAQLRWVLLDIGKVKSHRKLLDFLHSQGGASAHHTAMPDLLTTLLKQGKRKEIIRVAERTEKEAYLSSLLGREFIYWPLANFLDNHGYLGLKHEVYHEAISKKIPPPTWWDWETP